MISGTRVLATDWRRLPPVVARLRRGRRVRIRGGRGLRLGRRDQSGTHVAGDDRWRLSLPGALAYDPSDGEVYVGEPRFWQRLGESGDGHGRQRQQLAVDPVALAFDSG